MMANKLVEGGPPVHAVGERADRPHVGALVIDVAARNDKLGEHVGKVHGRGSVDQNSQT